jgi:energy-coupling factor transporter transmembrane protein EcfT
MNTNEIYLIGVIFLFVVILFSLLWKIKNKFIRTIVRPIFSVVFILIFVVFCFIMYPVFFPGYHPIPFDKNKWAVMDNKYVMVRDIIYNKILIGKTKKDVAELLGKGTDNYPPTDAKSEWIYYIGPMPCLIPRDSGMAVLFVRFANGLVVEVFYSV